MHVGCSEPTDELVFLYTISNCGMWSKKICPGVKAVPMKNLSVTEKDSALKSEKAEDCRRYHDYD